MAVYKWALTTDGTAPSGYESTTYTDVSTWSAAEAFDLTTSGDDAYLDAFDDWASGHQLTGEEVKQAHGWETDDTNYVTLRVADGEGHGGSPYGGFYAEANSHAYPGIRPVYARVDLDGWQIDAVGMQCYEVTYYADNPVLNACIFVGGGYTSKSLIGNNVATNVIVLNSLFINQYRGSDKVPTANCTFDNMTSYGVLVRSVTPFKNNIITNCNGSSDPVYNEGAGSDYNATDYSSITGSNSVTSITDTDNYTAIGSDDYSVKGTGADIYDAGTDLSGTYPQLAYDIAGNSRSATYSIGAYEYVSSGISGDLEAQESGSDSASITGSVPVAGDLSAQESGSDTAAFSGFAEVPVTGDLAAQEAGADTAAITGSVLVAGTLSVQEAGADSADISGSVTVSGTLAAQETGTDSAALTGTVEVIGDLSAIESGADVAAITGQVHVSGTLSAQETGADTAAIVGDGDVPIVGTLDVTEAGSDTGVILGTVKVAGSLAVQETGADTAAISGTVPAVITGVLVAQESAADVASITGKVFIVGNLAAQESGSDTAAFSGLVTVQGDMAAQETGVDSAYFSSREADILGQMVATESGSDSAYFSTLFPVCFPWSAYSRSQSRLNSSLVRVFGEGVIFDPTGAQDEVKAILEWPAPDQVIGNAESPRPRPYLMMRNLDIENVTIVARQTVTVRGKTFTVVTDPVDDGFCMTYVYVRGEL